MLSIRTVLCSLTLLLLLGSGGGVAQAAQPANCVGDTTAAQLANLSAALDAQKSLYQNYVSWLVQEGQRGFWQGKITDHNNAVADLRNQQATIISSLGSLYTDGDTVFKTGAAGSGFNAASGQFYKGIKPFMVGEDKTTYLDVVSGAMNTTPPAPTNLTVPKSAREEASDAVSSAIVNNVVSADVAVAAYQSCRNNVQPASYASSYCPPPSPNSVKLGPIKASFCDGKGQDVVLTLPAITITGVVTAAQCWDHPDTRAWAGTLQGQLFEWAERRKKEIYVRADRIKAMRALDDLNTVKKQLQQQMAVDSGIPLTGANGIANFATMQGNADVPSFIPQRYTQLYNRLASLRSGGCASDYHGSLDSLYRQVTGESRQYDPARLLNAQCSKAARAVCTVNNATQTSSCTLDGQPFNPACQAEMENCTPLSKSRTMAEQGEVAVVVNAATSLGLTTADFDRVRSGGCGPVVATVAPPPQDASCPPVATRYSYPIPETIAWAQKNAGAIPQNKQTFGQLTCGTGQYPIVP
jgi:hypothetical protein